MVIDGQIVFHKSEPLNFEKQNRKVRVMGVLTKYEQENIINFNVAESDAVDQKDIKGAERTQKGDDERPQQRQINNYYYSMKNIDKKVDEQIAVIRANVRSAFLRVCFSAESNSTYNSRKKFQCPLSQRAHFFEKIIDSNY